MRPLILLLLLLGLLSGCEEPTATFDAFALPRPVNMARVLGPAPVLLGPHDTLALQLRFNAATGFTDFSLAGDSVAETWFTARAFRFRGLYYLVEEQPDSGYWVHAVRIRRGQVQGLGTGYQQMLDVSQGAKQGRWPALIRFRTLDGDSLRLHFDRKQLHAFYRAELDSFSTYRLAAPPTTRPHVMPLATHAAEQSPSLYPNPATSTATVVFGEASARQVMLYNDRGQLLRTYPTSGLKLILPVSDLPNGPYVVRVHASSPAAPAALRLLVAH